MKKQILFLSLLVLSTLPMARAEEFFVVPEKKFSLVAENVEGKIEDLLQNPEPVLKRFRPAGAKITEKNVSGNRINFKANKTVMFITKTVYVNGVLDVVSDNLGCLKNQKGYLATFDLLGSDGLVYDNIDRIEARACITIKNGKNADISVKAKLFKAANYSSTLGGIVKGLIEAQVDPLFLALTEEVRARK